jgi:hypothetical protein
MAAEEGQRPDDQREHRELPQLDADVEEENARNEAVFGEAELLQAGGEAEAVDEAEREDDRAEEAPVVGAAPPALDADVDDAEGDDEVDDGGVELPTRERREPAA